VAHHPDAFVTVTKVVTEPGNTAAVLGILREIVVLDAGEPGTLVQTVQVDRAAPSVIWLYEVWASAEALEAHRANGAVQRERLAPLISGTYEVHPCTPLFGHGLDLEAIVRGPDGQATRTGNNSIASTPCLMKGNCSKAARAASSDSASTTV